MDPIVEASPASIAAAAALEEVLQCIDTGRSFKLEAGAGAGKTYSLVQALKHIIQNKGVEYLRKNQRVACITYTNVANDEVVARTDGHPVVLAATIHTFCWEVIKGFQPRLRTLVQGIASWSELLDATEDPIASLSIEYDLGYRRIKNGRLWLHHDDVILLTSKLFDDPKFRLVFAARFPVVFIDEYQDTNQQFAQSIVTHFIDKSSTPLIGLFGDGWQKIYGTGAGNIQSSNLREIGKKANFRSSKQVVESLNRIRPQLPQEIKDPLFTGSVSVYHSNNWQGTRRSEAHWKGDLPEEVSHKYLERLRNQLMEEGWEFDPKHSKILMLTHAVLGAEQGYGSIVKVFKYNDAFIKKEDAHLAFLMDTLEPVCDAYQAGQYGLMFTLLGERHMPIRGTASKKEWAATMATLSTLRVSGTVGDVLAHLKKSTQIRLPDSVRDIEKELAQSTDEQIAESRPLQELQKLHDIAYSEVRALARFVNDHTPFATKHGVKGAEYDDVLVVFGRGWNHYDWNKFLERHPSFVSSDQKEMDGYERNRNLFYVACSRAKKRMVLLFTQVLSTKAMTQLELFFGKENIHSLDLS